MSRHDRQGATPPGPGHRRHCRPSAKVVTRPVLRSIRAIVPMSGWVTYKAPSGPMVLPAPRPRPVTMRVLPAGGVGDARGDEGEDEGHSDERRRPSDDVHGGSFQEPVSDDRNRAIRSGPRRQVTTSPCTSIRAGAEGSEARIDGVQRIVDGDVRHRVQAGAKSTQPARRGGVISSAGSTTRSRSLRSGIVRTPPSSLGP